MENRLKLNESNFFYISTAMLFLLFIFDLSNLDGLRQGTEGFYLQISSEMFENKAYLTPTYLGDLHWSKPPLHFWFAQPFYYIFENKLFAARLSTLCIYFSFLLYICYWLKKYSQIKPLTTLLFFSSTLGIIKYSRIYMMEIPLMVYATVANLLFFEFVNSEKIKFLLFAIFFSGIGCLVKGPVSFVMSVGSLLIWSLLIWHSTKQILLKHLFVFVLASVSIASIWFFYSYYVHGYRFIELFFIRENMGKFTSKSYPISVVFQGLILFALPHTFLMFFCKKNILTMLKNIASKKINLKSVDLFLLINFICYFALWLFPKQKSHHYAIPSIGFLIALLLIKFNELWSEKNKKINILYLSTSTILGVIVLILTSITLYLSPSLPNDTSLWINIIVLIFIVGILIGLYFYKNPNFQLFSLLGIITSVWIFLAPNYYLPVIPKTIKTQIGQNNLGVVYRKPFFIKEGLNRTFTNLAPSNIQPYIENNQGYYLMREEIFNEFVRGKRGVTIVKSWPVWKRGSGFKKIVDAISKKDLTALQENMILSFR